MGKNLLQSVDEALEIYWITGVYLWRKATNKDMARVKIHFKTHDEHTTKQIQTGKVLVITGYQKIDST